MGRLELGKEKEVPELNLFALIGFGLMVTCGIVAARSKDKVTLKTIYVTLPPLFGGLALVILGAAIMIIDAIN